MQGKPPRCVRFASPRIAVVLAALTTAATLIACSSYPSHLEAPVAKAELAEIHAPQDSETNGRKAVPRILGIDGVSQRDFRLTPGLHKIEISTTWSNGWSEKAELTVNAVAGKKYLVLAYESVAGQDPARAALWPKGTLSPAAREGLAGAFQGLLPGMVLSAPLWVPIMMIFEKQPGQPVAAKPGLPPESRPFPACCFVWIEDRETGQLVDGARPSGLAGYWPAR